MKIILLFTNWAELRSNIKITRYGPKYEGVVDERGQVGI